MMDNDIVILNNLIEQKKKELELTDIPKEDYFRLFTFEQTLKNFDLDFEQIKDGDVDGGDDGGIDGIFFFINSELMEEDVCADEIKKKPVLDLFLVQSKNMKFSETAMDKILVTSGKIFNLSEEIPKTIYNERVVEKANIFRTAYLALTSKFPELKIHVYYATTGDTENIHNKVQEKKEDLIKSLKKLFPNATVEVKFFGSKELLNLARREKDYTLTLKFIENYLSKGKDNYLVLVNLKDYYDFVVDENANLRQYLFESNVRDFQGYVEVNNDISGSLLLNDKVDFWWLNNGVTILASESSVAGKNLTLKNVQIVNGLQTTKCVYDFFRNEMKKDKCLKDDTRSILIKIIIIQDEKTKDRVIKATNFQTSIPPASLKAGDKIHYDLEDYLKAQDLFYDRRKNHYKNLGKPVRKIIGIPFMAQCVNTILLKDPTTSRARPSSLVKNESLYSKIFDDKTLLMTYLFCVQTVRKVQGRLKKDTASSDYEKVNLKFHIAMVSVIKILSNTEYGITDVDTLKLTDLSDKLIDESILETIKLAQKYGQKKKLSIDVIAKSKGFADYLKRKVKVSVDKG